MAIDTRDKRASVVALRRLRWPLPDPDNNINISDREHLTGHYRGISALSQVNSRNKRASVLGRRTLFRRILPDPAVGVIDANDRKQLAGFYRQEPATLLTTFAASASLTGTLTTQVQLSAALLGEATLVGTQLTSGLIALDASLAGVASLTGALTTGIRLSTHLQGNALILSATFNRAPVITGLPAKFTFTRGNPINLSVAAYASDPDNDPLNIWLSAGPAGLPNGLTYDSANKRFVWNGSGPVTPVNNPYKYNRLIADDGFGMGTLMRGAAVTFTGILSQVQPLNASLAGQATLTGILTGPSEMSVILRGQAALTGNLRIGAGLSATLSGVSTLSANLGNVTPLAATLTGLASISAGLGGGADALVATLTSSASLTGALTTSIRLSTMLVGTAEFTRTALGPNPIFESALSGTATIHASLRAPGKKGNWTAEGDEDSTWQKELSLEES